MHVSIGTILFLLELKVVFLTFSSLQQVGRVKNLKLLRIDNWCALISKRNHGNRYYVAANINANAKVKSQQKPVVSLKVVIYLHVYDTISSSSQVPRVEKKIRWQCLLWKKSKLLQNEWRRIA